jgi:hypothetical protein
MLLPTPSLIRRLGRQSLGRQLGYRRAESGGAVFSFSLPVVAPDPD